MKLQTLILAGLGITVSATGCGSSAAPPEHLNFVNGRVAFTDSRIKIDSVDHSIVQFHPESGESNGEKIWGSLIEGSFSISTEWDDKRLLGAPEGDYLVTISPPSPATGQRSGNLNRGRAVRTVIPTKYRDATTSDLRVHIKKGINELPEFELTP